TRSIMRSPFQGRAPRSTRGTPRIRPARGARARFGMRGPDARARVHHRASGSRAAAVGPLPALRSLEGVCARGAGRRDRLARGRGRQRAVTQGDLSTTVRPPRRILRAGEERAAGPRVRLRDAAVGTLRIGRARATGTESHAAPLPRALPHAYAGPA